MKTCPVCKAVAFDDQMTCYGCLHDFGKAQQAGDTAIPSQVSQSGLGSAKFVLSLVPEQQDSGTITWSCAVESLSE